MIFRTPVKRSAINLLETSIDGCNVKLSSGFQILFVKHDNEYTIFYYFAAIKRTVLGKNS